MKTFKCKKGKSKEITKTNEKQYPLYYCNDCGELFIKEKN